MLKKYLVLFFALSVSFLAQAQVYSEPVFPTESAPVTIYFDASKGTAGLNDCNCDVYLHTGVTTTLNGGWQYVKTSWGVANAAWKMTKVSANLYKYDITPSIRAYYGVPAGTDIKQMTFVFRNDNGSKEGKADGGKDIYYTLSDDQFFDARLVDPVKNATLLKKQGETIVVKGAANKDAKLTLKDNGQTIKEVAAGKSIEHTITVAGGGIHEVEFSALFGNEEYIDKFSYVVSQEVTVQNPPAGIKLGPNQSGNNVTLMLNAPDKSNVFVIGDFSDWQIKPENLLRRSVDGQKWWITLDNLPNGAFRYQYVVDGNIRIADPHSPIILDEGNDKGIPASNYANLPAYPATKTAGYVTYLDIPRKNYNWQVTNFQRPAKTDMIVYELLVRDFSSARNFQYVIDSLDYLKRLGINAIEFMPVNEYDNNQSWGYNPTFHHALDKFYGSADTFKKLVDECHKRGIAVIIDVVFNHVSEKGPIAQLYPISNSPYVNAVAKHPFNVFLDMNHESTVTREYVKRCIEYWLEEYKIDGYRFDLSKGFTQKDSGSDVGKWGQYDATRIAILKDYHNVIQTTSPGAFTVLEHLSENKEEAELAQNGMMLWQHANYAFTQGIMGFSAGSSFSNTYYKNIGYTQPNNLAYAESHDEERMMYKAKTFGKQAANYDVRNIVTGLRRAEMMAMLLLGVPGPKMIWQFGETGFDYSINDCGNGTINNNCRLSIKPARWDYLQDPARKRLFDVYRSMIELHKNNPIIQSPDNVYLFTGGLVKQLVLTKGTDHLVMFGNIDIEDAIAYSDFPVTGKYYDYFSGNELNVDRLDLEFTMRPGEYRLYSNKPLGIPYGGYKQYTADKDAVAQKLGFNVYPNPTLIGETTNVAFELPNTATVSLEVTDLSGRVLETIVNGQQPAGVYQYDTAADLPAGAYMIRLSVNQQISTKKIIKF